MLKWIRLVPTGCVPTASWREDGFKRSKAISPSRKERQEEQDQEQKQGRVFGLDLNPELKILTYPWRPWRLE